MTTENKPHEPRFPNTLESFVPPLDLCRKIPKGDFGYSALTWNEGYVKGNFVIEQRGLGRYYICPAPTLQEILAEFKPPKYYGLQMAKLRSGIWQVLVRKDIWISKGVTQILCYGEDYSPVIAALKLYLNLLSVQSDQSVSQEVQP